MADKGTFRKMWQFPWGYRESFLIVIGLMIVGFILEYLTGGQIVKIPSWPVNLILLLFFIAYLIVTYYFVKGPVMVWLSSVPAAMASMAIFTFLVILMGFIPQGNPQGFAGRIGLNHIHTSKPYIIIAVFMLTVLGYTIIRRMRQRLNMKNVAFLLNHLGLFIILTAASVGSSDLLRLRMPVFEGEATNIAYPDEKHRAEMPFTIYLHSFTIEEYQPELIVFDGKYGMPVLPKGKSLPHIEKGISGKILNYSFDILDYIPFAVPYEDKYIASEQFGSTHAAFVSIKSGSNEQSGWISCGNFMYQPKYIILNEHHILGMTTPKVKKYVSLIDVYSKDGTSQNGVEISVNKPLKFGRWKIYQHSYDDKLGRWSQISVFEVIRDPWLPVVYAGIFMILAGSLYLLWVGRKIEISNSQTENESMNKTA